jgi:hypothetical protein
VPVVVFLFGSRGPDPGTATANVAGLLLHAAAGVTIHVALSSEPAFRVLMLGVVTTALTAAAAFGVFFLVLVGGSLGLRRSAVHGVWAVPVSLLVAGIWLVGVATVLTGSTGACLD